MHFDILPVFYFPSFNGILTPLSILIHFAQNDTAQSITNSARGRNDPSVRLAAAIMAVLFPLRNDTWVENPSGSSSHLPYKAEEFFLAGFATPSSYIDNDISGAR